MFHWYACASQIVLPFVAKFLINIVVLHDDLPPRRALPRLDSDAIQSKIWVFGGRNELGMPNDVWILDASGSLGRIR